MTFFQDTAPAWGPVLSLLGILWCIRRPAPARPDPVSKEELQRIVDGIDMTAIASDVAANLEKEQGYPLGPGATLTVTGNVRYES